MIDEQRLREGLQRLLRDTEGAIRERIADQPSIEAQLRERHTAAVQAGRTAGSAVGYNSFADEAITQSAAQWLLGCVFVRFLEDNGWLDERAKMVAWIAGTGERLSIAKDHRTLFLRPDPDLTDRDYLLYIFSAVAKLPGMAGLFDPRHNPLFQLGPTAQGAAKIVDYFQKVDPDTNTLIHDFTDPEHQTRFLGDLYQHLSESARKRYALCQTPGFVIDFILDRTLTPAIDTFGLAEVRLIDPACGSGHFLLAAFARLFQLWQQREPATNPPALAQKALDAIYGVDLNPFAAEISRFRLLIAALEASGVARLRDALDFRIQVAAGDSLLHGSRPRDVGGVQTGLYEDRVQFFYETEDADDVKRILSQAYHVVVGNQPLNATLIRQWNDASEQWAARLCGGGRVNEVREELARADRILESIGASEYAAASRWSPLGFQQRLTGFASALNGGDPGQLRQAFAAVNTHEAASRLEELRGRRDRAEMAARLCRWLDRMADTAATLDAAVDQYLRGGAWVDWARHQLLAGDEPEAVSRSYRRLFDRATERREQENRVFAGLLAAATAANQFGARAILIENVLDRVVAPPARIVPAGVLAVVMDGMSWAVLRELSPDLARHGWLEWVPLNGDGFGCALAALPSVTSFSRASLLCGSLVSGGQATEKRGFEEHDGLRAIGRSSFAPVLFHKDEIGASGGDLAEAARLEIRNPNRKVVGAVVNVVDDSLEGPEQLAIRWTLDQVPVLRALLSEARDAGRIVEKTNLLMEKRLASITQIAPAFSATLRGYRAAMASGDNTIAEALLAWVSGQPNVAAAAKRAAGIKGEVDHFGALCFLQGLLVILRDGGFSGLVVVLDEVETLQRVRGDVREKALNALRQLIDEVHSGRFPGLYLLITGTPAFFDGPQGIQKLPPLAQRLHVDFGADPRFDNPRSVQVRLRNFDIPALVEVGCRVRDLFADGSDCGDRVRSVADDAYVTDLARALTGRLGGKVGLAPRLFLKKLVGDVLDRIELFPDFDPRRNYELTLSGADMNIDEREAATVDDIELNL
jgi:hypothetical protein